MAGNIHHAGLTVRDADRSAAWYHKVLGFERTGNTALPTVHAGRSSCG
jgi:catechol 2,3-dioxygenase-like lactoylglutathione lyase family enzyme